MVLFMFVVVFEALVSSILCSIKYIFSYRRKITLQAIWVSYANKPPSSHPLQYLLTTPDDHEKTHNDGHDDAATSPKHMISQIIPPNHRPR